MQHSSRFNALTAAAKTHVKETDINTVKQKHANQESFYLIDVREESEWAKGHLPKAIHLSKGIIEVKIENVIPDIHAEIILYCGGGNRSLLAADNLQKMGYTQVKSLTGGFRAWTAAGFDLEN